jgi:type IV secretory pathway VirB2 component (pilin)
MEQHRNKKMGGDKPPFASCAPSAIRITSAALLCFLTVMATATNAYAITPMAEVLCYVLEMFQGNLGKGLATIGMCILGLGAVMGKVSWGMALTVGVGISIMVYSSDLVEALQLGVVNCVP